MRHPLKKSPHSMLSSTLGRIRRALGAGALPAQPTNTRSAYIDSLAPLTVSLEERIAMAERCRDADAIPKVDDAGAVVSLHDGTKQQIMHNGLRVVVDGYCGEWMTDLIRRCRGHHEPQEERVFHELLPHLSRTGTMLELGGWWSFYSMWFMQNQPGRRALIVEPDPQHMHVGMENAKINGLNPLFINGFAGATPSDPIPFQIESGGEILVPRLSVPQILRDQGLEQLDVLHCDAQGAEHDVVVSCAELFRQARIKALVLSTHHWSISGSPITHQLCLNSIVEFGGRVIAEHDVYESFSGDGLIVAVFGDEMQDVKPVPLTCNRYSTSLFRNPVYDLAIHSQG